MEKKKILILFEPLGAGHESAAKAITQAFNLKYPEIEVKSVDASDFSFEISRQLTPWIYNYVTTRVPFLYKLIYEYSDHKLRRKILRDISSSVLKKSHFVKFIQDFAPDFIISTNPLPMQLVSKTKEKKIIDIPSANVCTDFGFHPFWHNEDVNYYFVANEEIKESLIKYDVNYNKIKITGIPTSSKFSKPVDRKKIIDNLGLDALRPILLIVGGRTSYKNLSVIISGIRENNNDLQFIIVAGRDNVLLKNLENSEIKKDATIRIFGFVNNLDEYMSVADLIMTKAGGLTVSECLVKNLPMVINDVIPGQEDDNVKYVVNHGAAIKATNAEEVISVVNDLLLNPEKIATMKENCKKIAKPNAAIDLVDFVVSETKN
jgi:processive 1,2-diacylglycerol beta-glucosyltransferase